MIKLTLPTLWQTDDFGLLFLRISSALLVLYVHGLPKLFHWQTELQHIDDPLHFGAMLTLLCALFAEIVCPLFIFLGLWTRLACLPLLFLLLVSMLLVHADWSIEQGQFGWLLMIVFTTIAVSGPGKFTVKIFSIER